MKGTDIVGKVTDKTPGDLELIAVWSATSSVIHAMRVVENEGWMSGHAAKTVCGKILADAYASVEVAAGDRPCGSCDRSLAVLPVMFETAEVIGGMLEMAYAKQQRANFMAWLNHGIEQGFITPPTCAVHSEVFINEREQVEREAGEDPCIMIIRIDPGDSMR